MHNMSVNCMAVKISISKIQNGGQPPSSAFSETPLSHKRSFFSISDVFLAKCKNSLSLDLDDRAQYGMLCQS